MNQTLTRPEIERRDLSAIDRCDACGARAWVRAVLGETELLFCAHHGTKSIEGLEAVATFIQDDRALLLEQEM